MEDQLRALTQQLTDLTDSIVSQGENFNAQSEEFQNLARAVDRFGKFSRGPMEYLMNYMSTMTQFTSLRLFSEWNAVEHIPKDSAISYADLAAKMDADVSLVTRLSWNLVAAGIIRQVGDNEVTQTPVFAALSSAKCRAIIQLGYDTHLHTIATAADYFSKYGRREPASQLNTMYAFANGDPSLTVWEHMNRNPDRMRNFMLTMAVMTQQMPMVGSYDFHWVLERAGGGERPLIVDVGGGSGHALQAIHKTTPDLPLERCVVQDLPAVVGEAKAAAQGELARAKFEASDFHKEQPTKGALVYFIRRCLHDYSDKDCVNILQHIRTAMSTDSKCLILERIMPNPPSAVDAATDFFMATIGGKERTLEGFRLIAGQAGLKVDKAYVSEGHELSVVECSIA